MGLLLPESAETPQAHDPDSLEESTLYTGSLGVDFLKFLRLSPANASTSRRGTVRVDEASPSGASDELMGDNEIEPDIPGSLLSRT